MTKRVFLLVMDGAGIGEAPDAAQYGDLGSDTIGNVTAACRPQLPTLSRLGLFNVEGLCEKLPEYAANAPMASYGRMAEASPGKDTTTGHWELAGIILDKPFPLYPDGFPADWIAEYSRKTERGIIGNKAASGTAIIEELGKRHMETGDLIVYTSADSVLQIAAHESVVPVDELYRCCEIARQSIDVGRIIARPFAGRPGSFERTVRRKDFSLPPPEPNLLSCAVAAGLETIGVGKIEDIFAFRGLTRSYHTPDMLTSLDKVMELINEDFAGLVFVNLIDFDMLYGHRNDVRGFAGALGLLDKKLARLLTILGEHDILMITADHGCDPSTPSTDHSREYVPLLIYGGGAPSVPLGTKNSFADAGATIARLLKICYSAKGEPIIWN